MRAINPRPNTIQCNQYFGSVFVATLATPSLISVSRKALVRARPNSSAMPTVTTMVPSIALVDSIGGGRMSSNLNSMKPVAERTNGIAAIANR